MALSVQCLFLFPEGNQIMRNIKVPGHICEYFISDFCIYFPKRDSSPLNYSAYKVLHPKHTKVNSSLLNNT